MRPAPRRASRAHRPHRGTGRRAPARLRYGPTPPTPSLGAPTSASDRARLRGDRARRPDRRTRSATRPARHRRPRSRVPRRTRQASGSVPAGRDPCAGQPFQRLPRPARVARPLAAAWSTPRVRRLRPRLPGPTGCPRQRAPPPSREAHAGSARVRTTVARASSLCSAAHGVLEVEDDLIARKAQRLHLPIGPRFPGTQRDVQPRAHSEAEVKTIRGARSPRRCAAKPSSRAYSWTVSCAGWATDLEALRDLTDPGGNGARRASPDPAGRLVGRGRRSRGPAGAGRGRVSRSVAER